MIFPLHARFVAASVDKFAVFNFIWFQDSLLVSFPRPPCLPRLSRIHPKASIQMWEEKKEEKQAKTNRTKTNLISTIV